MIDPATPSGQIVASALRLAEQRPWDEISFSEIARDANLSLPELRRQFSGKAKILRAFIRAVDDEVLNRATNQVSPKDTSRDRLFDVLMIRFEVLQPYRHALRNIVKSGGMETELITPFLNSQRWMLIAAGLSADGMNGWVRTLGLGSAYASTFRTWLDDDDAGMAKTMASLDRRLRRGESWMSSVSDTCQALERLVCSLVPARRRREDNKSSDETHDEIISTKMSESKHGSGNGETPPDASPQMT